MPRIFILLSDKEKEQLLSRLQQYQKLHMKMEVITAFMTKFSQPNTQYFGLDYDIPFFNLANTLGTYF